MVFNRAVYSPVHTSQIWVQYSIVGMLQGSQNVSRLLTIPDFQPHLRSSQMVKFTSAPTMTPPCMESPQAYPGLPRVPTARRKKKEPMGKTVTRNLRLRGSLGSQISKHQSRIEMPDRDRGTMRPALHKHRCCTSPTFSQRESPGSVGTVTHSSDGPGSLWGEWRGGWYDGSVSNSTAPM